MHAVHTYTVAFNSSVLVKYSICSGHPLTHAPHERLKNTIHGICHTVILFHHGSVTWFYAGSVVIGDVVCPGSAGIVALLVVCGGGQLAKSPEL